MVPFVENLFPEDERFNLNCQAFSPVNTDYEGRFHLCFDI
jgi:hypothetical protein